MAIKSNLNVEIGDEPVNLIESTATDTSENRRFAVGNGLKEIEMTAWGSNDNQDWEDIETKDVDSSGYGIIILGNNHYFYVKLTGKTKSEGDVSIIDAYLTYTEP